MVVRLDLSTRGSLGSSNTLLRRPSQCLSTRSYSLRTFLISAVLLCQRLQRVWAQPSVETAVNYVWPSVLFNIQLASNDDTEGLSDAKFATSLAELALAGYQNYVDKILPKELTLDPELAAEQKRQDVSFTNLAFLRWQKRCFSVAYGSPTSEMNWDGRKIPFFREINYKWDEFFKSNQYKQLRSRVATLTNKYIRGNDKIPYKVFAWAEVYPPGVNKRPSTRTGSPAAGHFVVQFQNSSTGTQRLFFEDPRGINAPFGRVHRHDPVQGELMLWPSWLSNGLSVNRGGGTNVYIGLHIQMPGGAGDFDWEDDSLGDFTETTKVSMSAKPAGEKAKKEEL